MPASCTEHARVACVLCLQAATIACMGPSQLWQLPHHRRHRGARLGFGRLVGPVGLHSVMPRQPPRPAVETPFGSPASPFIRTRNSHVHHVRCRHCRRLRSPLPRCESMSFSYIPDGQGFSQHWGCTTPRMQPSCRLMSCEHIEARSRGI